MIVNLSDHIYLYQDNNIMFVQLQALFRLCIYVMLYTFRHDLFSIVYACTECGATPALLKVRQFNKRQLAILKNFFTVHHYANKTTRKELALQTGLHERQVINWLKRERFKTEVVKREEAQ